MSASPPPGSLPTRVRRPSSLPSGGERKVGEGNDAAGRGSGGCRRSVRARRTRTTTQKEKSNAVGLVSVLSFAMVVVVAVTIASGGAC